MCTFRLLLAFLIFFVIFNFFLLKFCLFCGLLVDGFCWSYGRGGQFWLILLFNQVLTSAGLRFRSLDSNRVLILEFGGVLGLHLDRRLWFSSYLISLSFGQGLLFDDLLFGFWLLGLIICLCCGDWLLRLFYGLLFLCDSYWLLLLL